MRVTKFDCDVRVDQPLIGGRLANGSDIRDENSGFINFSKKRCGEIRAARNAPTIMVQFQRVTRLALSGLDDIFVSF